ncbi:molybdate transport system substrate-binding protein [Lebetimonas natsushimae]|uniref:Molybdate transport system substrate-binding protein n=1 Tax=Lebetimonas natsushimae TaxID=1936991 RepID=A0A292Y9F3_9BACT|nr:molybdate ABC transporter substrate-binding protein [Lebetimonas natsushimae]GAX87512.1 molybdate transport system substrate-binding protein [Lebetimonas natsushimae]
MKKLIISFSLLITLFSMDLNKYGIVLSSTNMEFVMKKIFKKFYQKYPNDHILVQYESTGKAVKDILNGYPYDMFLSADKKGALKVYNAHKAVTKPKLYTKGSLIIFFKNLNDKNYNFLKNKKIKKILIGNKQQTVYGNRTIEVLKNLHLYEKIKNKIEYKKNIAEVVDDVIWSKNKVAFIPKSAINLLPSKYNKKGINWIEINPKLYSPINQYFVISKKGLKKKSVRDFAHFLLSKEGQKILTSNGYLPIK